MDTKKPVLTGALWHVFDPVICSLPGCSAEQFFRSPALDSLLFFLCPSFATRCRHRRCTEMRANVPSRVITVALPEPEANVRRQLWTNASDAAAAASVASLMSRAVPADDSAATHSNLCFLRLAAASTASWANTAVELTTCNDVCRRWTLLS